MISGRSETPRVGKKGKSVGESACNDKIAPKKFQKTVIQTLLQKDSRKSDLSESDEDFVVPQFVGTTLDLTKKRLREFPNELLKRAEFVQYLYLESNKLGELPESFFECLSQLKWLDLRNNELVALPNAGLKNHTFLEFLLLQSNRIKYLPTELGDLPNLKGLQITGNPIINVPHDVIADGFQSVVNHLRKLNSQEEILLPSTDAIVVRQAAVKDEDENREINILPTDEDKERISDGTILQKWVLGEWNHAPFGTWNEAKKLLMRSKMCPKPKQRIIACSYRPVMKKRSRLGYKRKMITQDVLEERAKRDMQMAKRKETLEKQARKIQRMKDREVLKAWRRQTQTSAEQLRLLDNYQQYPSRNFVMDTPFDVDPEFLNMLNRTDLYRSLKEVEAIHRRKKKTGPKLQISIGELERQMRDIKKNLESLNLSEQNDVSVSPRTKQNHLCNKIAQMQDLQKKLKSLHKRNSSVAFNSTPNHTNAHVKKTAVNLCLNGTS